MVLVWGLSAFATGTVSDVMPGMLRSFATARQIAIVLSLGTVWSHGQIWTCMF